MFRYRFPVGFDKFRGFSNNQEQRTTAGEEGDARRHTAWGQAQEKRHRPAGHWSIKQRCLQALRMEETHVARGTNNFCARFQSRKKGGNERPRTELVATEPKGLDALSKQARPGRKRKMGVGC